MHKRGVISSLLDKILLLLHPEFQQKNFSFNLLSDSYPLDMIFSSIMKRLSVKFQHFNNHINSCSFNEIKKDNYCVISYTNTGEKFVLFFKNVPDFKLAFYRINKLNRFIRVHKISLLIFSHSSIVYKITCLHCKCSYVGQTRCLLKNIIDEHRNHHKKNSSQTSVIIEHRLEHSHKFD